uniref:Fucolectin tachylectin-4 pentraxin-1 domain-containing protein n=1 Tax=Oreochromis aureus TaxID=47969 RepID=A0AAZ1WX81_OREAU
IKCWVSRCLRCDKRKPLQNVALKKPTVQSSTSSPPFLSSKAVDGYKNGNIRGAGFSHTKEETNPWWRVDLLAVYKVNAVTIINRQDCCSERILGVEIRIGDSLDQSGNQNPRCGIIESLDGTPTYTFHCNEMEGRYINVFMPAPLRVLTLCEVEVFASLPGIAVLSSGICGSCLFLFV